MNLPVLCRVLGNIPLHDVDVGSAVLDAINSCIKIDEPLFEVDMTGVKLYFLYKSLSPSSRLILEDLELLSKVEWVGLFKQCEMLAVQFEYRKHSKELYIQYAYIFVVTLCMLVAFFLGLGYIATLSLQGDNPDSYLLRVIYNLVTFYITEEQI